MIFARAYTRHLGKRTFLSIYICPEAVRGRFSMDCAENWLDWSLGMYLQTFFGAWRNFCF